MAKRKRGTGGADLLHLLTPWVAGARLAAGECLLSHEPVPTRLYGEPCPVQGCFIIACGVTEQLAAARLAEHRRRCHGRR